MPKQCCCYESCHGHELTHVFVTVSLTVPLVLSLKLRACGNQECRNSSDSNCAYVVLVMLYVCESLWPHQLPGCFPPRAASFMVKSHRIAGQFASLMLMISSRSGVRSQDCSRRQRSSTPSSVSMMPTTGATSLFGPRG